MFRSLRRRAIVSVLVVVLAGLTLWAFWPSSGISDLVYATPDGIRLTLDLDFPSPHQTPAPVILVAPPEGGWPRALKREPRFRMMLEKLTGHGYAVATVHYRLPAQQCFPAQIEDGKAAVRWLRANAERYRLDASRIGVIGVCAGGWGTCMLGTTDSADGFEGYSDDTELSSRVQAVVCIGVPADFEDKIWPERFERTYLLPFLGTRYEKAPELYKRASPGTYASPDDPPFLLFHSTDDLVVPVEMSRVFAERLRRAGVSVDLVEAPSLEHVWGGDKLERALEQTLEFFDRHIRSREKMESSADNEQLSSEP